MTEPNIAREALIEAHTLFTAARSEFESVQDELRLHAEDVPVLKEHAEKLVGTIASGAGDTEVRLAEDLYLAKHHAAVAFHNVWLRLQGRSTAASKAMTEALTKLEQAKATYFNTLAPYPSSTTC